MEDSSVVRPPTSVLRVNHYILTEPKMSDRKKTVSKIVMTACCLLLAAVAVSCGPLGRTKGKEALAAP